ncbi:MAG: hypothetical protein IPM07_14340 [Anaerolineales bacterium]|nr:hypothetical protein [Anaerolineales bacterium]
MAVNNVDQWGWGIGWPRGNGATGALPVGRRHHQPHADPTVLINSGSLNRCHAFFVDAVRNAHNVAPKPEGVNYDELLPTTASAMYPNGSWMFNFMKPVGWACGWHCASYPLSGAGAAVRRSCGRAHLAAPATLDGDKLMPSSAS